MKKLSFAAVAAIAALTACTSSLPKTDRAAFVDPMIGTGGHGHTFPGPVVPHGMIQPGPDSRIHGWDACSGYHYSDSTINGFAQTHLSGTGIGDYGDFLIMPTVGRQCVNPQDMRSQNRPYASAFSHDDEVAEAGYYSVVLSRYDIKTEITAGKRAAIYRFTFPECDRAGMIVDIDYSNQNGRNVAMTVEAIGDSAIRASKVTDGWAKEQRINLYAKFSKPFTCTVLADTVKTGDGGLVTRCKALLSFSGTKAGEEILAKLAISAVDTDGAEHNLSSEIPDWDFDGVRAEARRQWDDYLSRIDISTDNDSDRTIFYTALYHTAISPNLFSDADGRYLGMDHKIRKGDPDHPIYTIFSLWDTHRALHPLMTIIDPALNNDFIRSLLAKYSEGGILPKWELAANYTATMPGYHAVSLLADAVTKGIADFDVDEAYRAARRSSAYDTTGIAAPRSMVEALVQKSKYYKDALGFIPWDSERESVAKGLEYAYDDWCVAQLAKAAGDSAGFMEYYEKSKAYANYFDPATRFMRGKDAEGRWHEPFNPRSSDHGNDDYCEGTAWQWAWFVPHDIDGLVSLMGGRESFVGRLDSLFTADSTLEGENASADISGLIGQYAHGNEPSHHIIHLFNYAGRPDRTQELVDQVLREQYRADVDGLSGNEDCGQMSAWYVMNSLGFYQVCPGEPVYSIGRPWFPHAEISLGNGKSFVIDVENFSKDNKYIESVTLNGRRLSEPFISHSDIAGGGSLHLVMSPTKL